MPRSVDYPKTVSSTEVKYGSQKAFAESVGVSPRTVQRWKNGEQEPKSKHKAKIYRRARHYNTRRYEDEGGRPPPVKLWYRGIVSSGMTYRKEFGADVRMEVIVWETSRARIDMESLTQYYWDVLIDARNQFPPLQELGDPEAKEDGTDPDNRVTRADMRPREVPGERGNWIKVVKESSMYTYKIVNGNVKRVN